MAVLSLSANIKPGINSYLSSSNCWYQNAKESLTVISWFFYGIRYGSKVWNKWEWYYTGGWWVMVFGCDVYRIVDLTLVNNVCCLIITVKLSIPKSCNRFWWISTPIIQCWIHLGEVSFVQYVWKFNIQTGKEEKEKKKIGNRTNTLDRVAKRGYQSHITLNFSS